MPKRKSLLNRLSTGDKIFATIAFVLVFSLSYQFAFGNHTSNRAVLGEHDETSVASSEEVSTPSTQEVSTQSTDEVDEVSTESTEEVDEVSTQSTDEVDELSTQSTDEESTEDDADEDSTDEQSTQSTQELEEEFGEAVTTRQRTRIERLFLLVPVEIESEEIVSETTGEVIAERQTLIGRLLDLFSF